MKPSARHSSNMSKCNLDLFCKISPCQPSSTSQPRERVCVFVCCRPVQKPRRALNPQNLPNSVADLYGNPLEPEDDDEEKQRKLATSNEWHTGLLSCFSHDITDVVCFGLCLPFCFANECATLPLSASLALPLRTPSLRHSP